MHQIQISDQLFADAQRAAAAQGFGSVDDYVSSIVRSELHGEDHDDLFTPEVIAELDAISASVKAGAKTFTQEEVDQRLEATKAAWRKKQAS